MALLVKRGKNLFLQSPQPVQVSRADSTLVKQRVGALPSIFRELERNNGHITVLCLMIQSDVFCKEWSSKQWHSDIIRNTQGHCCDCIADSHYLDCSLS